MADPARVERRKSAQSSSGVARVSGSIVMVTIHQMVGAPRHSAVGDGPTPNPELFREYLDLLQRTTSLLKRLGFGSKDLEKDYPCSVDQQIPRLWSNACKGTGPFANHPDMETFFGNPREVDYLRGLYEEEGDDQFLRHIDPVVDKYEYGVLEGDYRRKLASHIARKARDDAKEAMQVMEELKEKMPEMPEMAYKTAMELAKKMNDHVEEGFGPTMEALAALCSVQEQHFQRLINFYAGRTQHVAALFDGFRTAVSSGAQMSKWHMEACSAARILSREKASAEMLIEKQAAQIRAQRAKLEELEGREEMAMQLLAATQQRFAAQRRELSEAVEKGHAMEQQVQAVDLFVSDAEAWREARGPGQALHWLRCRMHVCRHANAVTRGLGTDFNPESDPGGLEDSHKRNRCELAQTDFVDAAHLREAIKRARKPRVTQDTDEVMLEHQLKERPAPPLGMCAVVTHNACVKAQEHLKARREARAEARKQDRAASPAAAEQGFGALHEYNGQVWEEGGHRMGSSFFPLAEGQPMSKVGALGGEIEEGVSAL